MGEFWKGEWGDPSAVAYPASIVLAGVLKRPFSPLTPDSVDALGQYLDGLGTQFSVFDTPLQGELNCSLPQLTSGNFKEAGDAKENYDLRKIFDGSLVQKRPIDAV